MLLGADRLFRRFQKTGDPRLLGQVFDRTAGELLKVALHLTRDRHRAEDLLQSTFLTAIEKVRTFDPERRVLPWLLAILANHARQAHRRERLPLPVPRAEGTDGDVADQVAARELADTCDRAIDALPEPYRHVLLLHLRHGIAGQEIAHALDRPDSTVRNQIARGLDLLRRRLPAGIASAAVLFTGGRGLAAVRAAVLARLPAASVAAAAVPLTLGVMVMNKKVLVLLVLVLAAGAAWYADVLPVSAQAPPPAFVTRQVVMEAKGVVERGPAAPAGERVEVAATQPGDAAPGAIHAEVSVAGDGRAVAGVPFAVSSSGQTTVVLAEGTTSAEGMADIAGLAAGDYWFGLPGREQGTWCRIPAGQTVTVKLAIPPGRRVEGIVVDRTGGAVARADVRCKAERDHVSTWLCRSERDGTFTADCLPDNACLWAVASDRQPSRLYGVGDGAKVRLVIGARGTTLRGRIVDERGQPAGKAVVFFGIDQRAGRPLLDRRMFDLRAADDGTFQVDWLPPGNLLVAAAPADADFERATVRWLEVEEGVAASVALQLGDSACVTGQVRDENGKPVASALVWAAFRGEDGVRPFDWHNTRTGEDGTFVLRGLVPGEQELSAEREFIHSKMKVRLERGQSLQWNPELQNGQTIAVRVLGPEGRPLRDYFVSLRRSDQITGYGGGRTDAEGRYRFEHLPPAEFFVRVSSYIVCIAEQKAVPGREEMVIRIDASHVPSASVRCRLVDVRGVAVPDVQLTWWHEGGVPQQTRRLTADAVFVTGSLPPGTYWIRARSNDPALASCQQKVTLAVKQALDLGDLVLPDAASLTVRLQTVDGGPVRGAVLRLDTRTDLSTVDLAPDEVDGVYRKTGIDPGSYTLRLFAADGLPQSIPLDLRGGERRELDVHVQRGVPMVFELKCADRRQSGIVNGMLTIKDAADQPVLTYRLWGYYEDWAQRIVRVRLALTPGHYRVTARESSEQSVGFTVPASPPLAPVVLDLR